MAKRDTLMKQLLEAKDSGLNETAAPTADNETLNSPEHGQARVPFNKPRQIGESV